MFTRCSCGAEPQFTSFELDLGGVPKGYARVYCLCGRRSPDVQHTPSYTASVCWYGDRHGGPELLNELWERVLAGEVLPNQSEIDSERNRAAWQKQEAEIAAWHAARRRP